MLFPLEKRVADLHQQPSNNVGLCLFLCGVFETFPSLINCILVFIQEILLAVSQHIFAISAIIPKISLCLHVSLLRKILTSVFEISNFGFTGVGNMS